MSPNSSGREDYSAAPSLNPTIREVRWPLIHRNHTRH